MKKLILTLCFFISTQLVYSQKEDSLIVYFYSGDHNLTPEAKISIDSLIQNRLRDNVIQELTINAYCDPSGSDKRNKELALKRAESVSEMLNAVNFKDLTTNQVSSRNCPVELNKDQYYKWRKAVIHYTLKVRDEENTKNNPFAGLSVESIKSKANNSVVLNIQFVGGEAILLNDSSYHYIYQLQQFMKNNKEVHAFIRGHVCCADDFPLSTRRAAFVYAELTTRGISHNRLSYQGFSNTKPKISPEITDADRQMNRRVDVIFSIPTEE